MPNKALKVGFARTDVTPEPGVRLGGYSRKDRPATEILDRLHASAIVLEQDGLKAAVVNLDWICIEEDIVEQIRQMVFKSTGIPAEHVTIAATHSHSVPNTLNFWGWGDREQAYIDSVLPEIVRSIELACADLKPAQIGFATTSSLVGVNRRRVNEAGKVGMVGDPQGSFDPTLTAAWFKDLEGNSLAFLVHYGAHGTAMGSNNLVSRDWNGVMKDRIESQFNAPVFFLNGAIGDVGPRTNYVRFSSGLNAGLSAGVGDGIEAVREVGYRAATDAISALCSIKEWRQDLKLKVLVEDIFLPYAPLKPLEEALKDLKEWEPRKDEWGTPMCEYNYNQAVIEAHKKPLLQGRTFKQVITAIGPLAIVPMPGEMFSGISLRVRQDSPFQYTLCCSVTNGSLAYLPTREARHRGGYETWVGKAAGPYLLADEIDDALVAENLKLLRKM